VAVGELGTGDAAPLGNGGKGIAGGGEGRDACDALLRIVELELERLTSLVEPASSNLAFSTTLVQFREYKVRSIDTHLKRGIVFTDSV
jgi:hypothetical protein